VVYAAAMLLVLLEIDVKLLIIGFPTSYATRTHITAFTTDRNRILY
jgi:hypothetical protein